METKINRRKLVALLTGAAGVGAAATVAAHADQLGMKNDPAEVLQKVPWPYKPLDPEKTAQRGFDGYYKSECMYGAFEAIVGSVVEQLGSPYKNFPFSMMKYGGGGVHGWATVCGSVNGASAAIQLLSPEPDALIDSLFEWYEQTPLPDVHPAAAKFPQIRSVSGSPLCHQSIAHWTKVSGKPAYCPERSERCGCLTASVARYAAIMLNKQMAGKPIVALGLPKRTRGCMSCHEKDGPVQDIRTKMECGGCHAPEMSKHPPNSQG